ncbi:CPBP family intramembrane metalloprotease [Candidatus Gottesmanbacteria bacterium]|nr:CPBP family intramembrane metalloprotease [Candidatus Gottesmanbacteria bacterium]
MKGKVKKGLSLEPIYQVWGWIALSWALYRYFLRLPEWADELVFKPAVFVLPVLWYVTKRERRPLTSLGLTTKNLFTSIYIGLGFGFVFAVEGLAANAIKYGRIQIQPITAFQQYGMVVLLFLSLATAFSEELLSRGFVFARILQKTKNLPYASVVSTALFVLLHIPILVATHQLQGMTLVLFFVTDTILGLANSLLYYSTSSLIAPILVHIFWNMTVALYL